MKSWKSISALYLSPSAMCALLSGCLAGENKTFFAYEQTGDEIELADDPSLEPNPGISPTPTPSPTPFATALTTQSFLAATTGVKKIDFLFVVDNSGSMADNQAKLAAGFEAFANTFYRRADLDICTAIITTDRYLGKTSGSYQRERVLPCTKPSNWSSLSAAQKTTYIDNLIQTFKTQVNVGTSGNGKEFVGKSLISYIYKLNSWGSTINPAVRTSFFRSDAVANISVVTDENNWYFTGPTQAETGNDLPAYQNAPIHNSQYGALDTRKGIKNYLDDFFTAAQPSHGLSYSISSLLEVNRPANTVPGLAMNLSSIDQLVGRESAKTDIAGDANSFTTLYNSISIALVQRASAFNVNHAIYEPLLSTNVIADLTVTIVKADNSRIGLNYGSNYTVLVPNGIILDSSASNLTASGDHVEVNYRYDLNN